jgi:hypothetical protein
LRDGQKGKSQEGGGSVNVTKAGAKGLLKRAFLRAFVREIWGIQKTMSYPELAAWMSQRGLETNLNDVKNSGRPSQPAVESIVPRIPETLALFEIMREGFPSMEMDKFFEGEDEGGSREIIHAVGQAQELMAT